MCHLHGEVGHCTDECPKCVALCSDLGNHGNACSGWGSPGGHSGILAAVAIPVADVAAVVMAVACDHLHVSLLGRWLLPMVAKQPKPSMGTPSSGAVSAVSALHLTGLPHKTPRWMAKVPPAHSPALAPPRDPQ